MSLEPLFELEGQWAGTYKLWLSPTDPPAESATSAGIKRGINGTSLKIAYDWAWEEKAQEGLILVTFNPNTEVVRFAWLDSFHMANDHLSCEGFSDGNKVNLVGSYRAPVGPSWYWRTILEASDDGGFAMRMFNIHPDGTEELAVEAIYERSGDS